MNDGLICQRSYLVCFGSIMQDISLLDDISRPLEREDFAPAGSLYELIFIAMYNLYANGCQSIDEFAVDSYLSSYKDKYKLFQDNNGLDYLVNCREMATIENYDYYYHRLRKFSMFRYYENKGQDTRQLADFSKTDPKDIQEENLKFESLTENDIVDYFEANLVITPRMKFCSNTMTTENQAGYSMMELVDGFLETPDIGIPLASRALNTITRGARKGCLYMRSAPTSGGKSRFAAADACMFSVPYYYDIKENKWINTGFSEPTLYITTELPVDEIQTLFIATVSGVNEDHILNGTYDKGEYERVKLGVEYITSSPLYICHIPDFSIEDIENIVKKYHREFNVDYFFFDYIHSSLRLMSEVSGKSSMRLREDQLLTIFVTKLKTICQQLDIFMMTASQLNGEWQTAVYKDQNLLAGAKALSFKLDIGVNCIRPSKVELNKVEPILRNMFDVQEPNMVTWVYKVRRGKLTRLCLWQYVDLGTMRITDLFVTNMDMEPIQMDYLQIDHVEKAIQENSIAIKEVKFEDPVVEVEETEDNETIEETIPFTF